MPYQHAAVEVLFKPVTIPVLQVQQEVATAESNIDLLES
jgi:hypothetical protein